MKIIEALVKLLEEHDIEVKEYNDRSISTRLNVLRLHETVIKIVNCNLEITEIDIIEPDSIKNIVEVVKINESMMLEHETAFINERFKQLNIISKICKISESETRI